MACSHGDREEKVADTSRARWNFDLAEIFLLRLDNFERQHRLSYLRSTVYLEERIRSLGLGLKMPHPEQVITLEDSGIQPVEGSEQKKYWAKARD